MKLKLILFILLSATSLCKAQNSFNNIFDYVKTFVPEIEKQGYEVVHLDFSILSESDVDENARRSLFTDYEYIIYAYGDPETIKRLHTELYENKNGKWELSNTGTTLQGVPSSSAIKFVPLADKEYNIKTVVDEFASPGKDAGRFFMIVAHKDASVILDVNAQEDIKMNAKNLKITASNYTSADYQFKINVNTSVIEQISSYSTKKYTLVKNVTDKDNTNYITYQIQDENGKQYGFQIDFTNNTIILLESSNRSNTLVGKRYYMYTPE
jgi:hypothetical protein